MSHTTHLRTEGPQTAPGEALTGHAIRPGMLFAAAAVLLSAGVSVDGGIISWAYRSTSPVATDRISYPWHDAMTTSTALTWGVVQLLFVGALVVFARSGAVGTSGAGRVGAWVTVAGGLSIAAAQALTLGKPEATTDDPAGVAVTAAFAGGSLAMLVGFALAGVAVLRAGRWTSWRRYAPLVMAGSLLAVVPLQFTPLLPLSVVVYGVATVWFGAALAAEGCEP